MVEAVGNKSSGKRRGMGDGLVKSTRKKQKTAQGLPELPNTLTGKGRHLNRIKDQVFRFMDLPGELRNRVYEFSIKYAHRCFPPIYRKDPKTRRVRASKASSSVVDSSDSRPLPYIGLTQVCSLLRSEFRPAWLSTNKIPFCALDSYLKAFLPRRNPRASPEAKKRFESQFDPSGSLRIWVRKDEIRDVAVTRLVKHAKRYPNYTITFQAMPDIAATLLTAMEALVSNKNALWVKYVKNNTISQVRFKYRGVGSGLQPIRVVVKEDYAPPWMKVALDINSRVEAERAEYVGQLGLSEVNKAAAISFGVDYS